MIKVHDIDVIKQLVARAVKGEQTALVCLTQRRVENFISEIKNSLFEQGAIYDYNVTNKTFLITCSGGKIIVKHVLNCDSLRGLELDVIVATDRDWETMSF